MEGLVGPDILWPALSSRARSFASARRRSSRACQRSHLGSSALLEKRERRSNRSDQARSSAAVFDSMPEKPPHRGAQDDNPASEDLGHRCHLSGRTPRFPARLTRFPLRSEAGGRSRDAAGGARRPWLGLSGGAGGVSSTRRPIAASLAAAFSTGGSDTVSLRPPPLRLLPAGATQLPGGTRSRRIAGPFPGARSRSVATGEGTTGSARASHLHAVLGLPLTSAPCPCGPFLPSPSRSSRGRLPPLPPRHGPCRACYG